MVLAMAGLALVACGCSGSGGGDSNKKDAAAQYWDSGKKKDAYKPPPKLDLGGKKKLAGEPCAANAQCKDGRCHRGICLAGKLGAAGAPCKGPAFCRSVKCVGGKCAPGTMPQGSGCLFPEECLSGKCVNGKCAAKPSGGKCAKDSECGGGVCYKQKCAKRCTKPSDCAAGEVCNTDNGKRVFCLKATYNTNVGKLCGATGSCPGGLTCTGTKYDWATFCRGSCSTDLDCPPALECEKSGSSRYCKPRRMCSVCAHDGSCPKGMKCVAMLGGKFCTSKCNPGSTECPMAASCKAAAGGHYCQPKGGKCTGNGGVCSPCTKHDQCNSGGLCLSFNLTEESFCGSDCTASGTCSGGFTCYKVSSTGQKQCGPSKKVKYATCTNGITFPIYNVGDVINDYAMVGYKDTNNNGTLTDEKTLQVIRLSDMAKGAKIILLNVSAFW